MTKKELARKRRVSKKVLEELRWQDCGRFTAMTRRHIAEKQAEMESGAGKEEFIIEALLTDNVFRFSAKIQVVILEKMIEVDPRVTLSFLDPILRQEEVVREIAYFFCKNVKKFGESCLELCEVLAENERIHIRDAVAENAIVFGEASFQVYAKILQGRDVRGRKKALNAFQEKSSLSPNLYQKFIFFLRNFINQNAGKMNSEDLEKIQDALKNMTTGVLI